MASLRVTSGLLPIPNNSEAVFRSVHILVSSFAAEASQVPFQVNRLAEDGAKVQIRSGVLAVPPGGAGRIVLDDVAGQTIEVNLQLPSDALDPSVTIQQTALASQTSDLEEWVSPDDFTQLPSLEAPPPSEPRVARMTTGLFPVDVSGDGTAPPFTHQLVLAISNFSEVPASASYVLNWARELFGAKFPLQQDTVTIEPGTAARIAFGDVAGKIVELNLELPPDALVPSVAVLRISPDGVSVDDVVLWISAQDMAPLRPLPANEGDA